MLVVEKGGSVVAMRTTTALTGEKTASTVSNLVHSSAVVNIKDTTGFSTKIDVPSGAGNPFLNSSEFTQGTFYIIFGPIIAGLIIFYLIGALINRIRARHNTKGADAIEDEYEMNQSIIDPFDTRDTHNDDTNSVYYQYPRHHQRNLTDISSLHKLTSDPFSDSDSVLQSLNEPSKTASPFTTTNKSFHKRRTSSMVLDDFISTGVLPELEGEHRLESGQVENHSMYQSQNDSYIADSRSGSPIRYSRSCSPVRRQ